MTCLSESQGYTQAFNDNVVPMGETRKGLDGKTYNSGEVWQRDCGVMQIGIAASSIGTPTEARLYDLYVNIQEARKLYEARGWQPWAGHASNVYLRDTYLKKATKGVGNFLGEVMLARVPTDTLNGTPYLHKLSNPVLEYMYRPVEMAAEVHLAHIDLMALKNLLTSTTNKALADRVAAHLSAAFGWLKK